MGFKPAASYDNNPVPEALFPRGAALNHEDVLRELAAREPIFHRPEFGTARADLDRMMAGDFSEVSASGRIFTREFVLELLEERHRTPQREDLQASGFQIRELAENLFLLRYDLLQGARKTRRTTIWRREGQDWKIVFHQGTIVQPE